MIFIPKQDTIIINGKDGKQMKQNGLTSEDIATHFYKGSINGQIGLKDFQIAYFYIVENMFMNLLNEDKVKGDRCK